MSQFLLSLLFSVFSISCIAQIDPIASYPFDGSAQDISGNEYHGVVHGAILTEDRFGNPNSAYFFDGFDDYIGIYQHPSQLTSGTINFWFAPAFNLDYTSDYAVLIETDTAGDVSGEFLIAFNRTNCFSTAPTNDGKIYFELQGDDENANDPDCPGFGLVSVSTDNDEWEAQKWQMITAVVCAEEETMKIYHNGELINTHTTSSDLFTGDRPFYIGKFGTDSPQDDSPFNGAIDDITIYEDCLGSETIRDLFNTGDPLNIEDSFIDIPAYYYNNPVQNDLDIQFDRNISSLEINCYSLSGTHVFSSSGTHNNIFSVDTNGWVAGTYIVKIKLDEYSYQFKFVKF